MLKIMARPRQAPCLLLGIGTYYVSAAHNTQLGAHKWQMLELRNPLILDGQQARAMFRRHHADSLDHKAASAGAWALRDEVTSQGHDAIIAVEGIGDERHLTIAHFDTASAVRGTASVIDFPAQSRGKKIAGSEAALARAS
ncbi:MAG TPA: hypothetical protein VHY80_12950 [Stellaceae bacterium]|nr:hypothetical protein [Stellaceae bacterium]